MLPATPEYEAVVRNEVASNRMRQFYPFAYALTDQSTKTHCWYCLSSADEKPLTESKSEKPKKLARCGGCRKAYFCNAQCQKRGWIDHSLECSSTKATGHLPTSAVRVLVRTMLRHKQIAEGQDTAAEFYWQRRHSRPVLDLMGHEEDIRADAAAMHLFERTYSDVLKWTAGKQLLDKDTLFKLHCRLLINSIKVSSHSYSTDVADALYPDLANYDHSCRPNAYYYCNRGAVMCLRTTDAAVDIDDYSQTFIAYVKLTNTRHNRQQLLRKTWYFDCNCARCNDPADLQLEAAKCPSCEAAVPWDGGGEACTADKHTQCLLLYNTGSNVCAACGCQVSADVLSQAKQAAADIESLLSGKGIADYATAKELLREHERLLPDTCLALLHLRRAALRLTADEQDRLRLHQLTLPCLRLCYDASWQVGFHLCAQAGRALRLGEHTQAVEYAREAAAMLEQCCGPQHPQCRAATQTLAMAVNALLRQHPPPPQTK